MKSSQHADTDKILEGLGGVPPNLEQLITQHAGRVRVSTQDADRLLTEFAQRTPSAPVELTSPKQAAPAPEPEPVAAAKPTPQLPAAERSRQIGLSIEPPPNAPLIIGRPSQLPPPDAATMARVVAEVARGADEVVVTRSRADTRDLSESMRPKPRPSMPDLGQASQSRPRVETRDFADASAPRPEPLPRDFGESIPPPRPRTDTRDFGESLPPLPRPEPREHTEVGAARARADTRDLISPNSRRPPLVRGLAGVEDLPELPRARAARNTEEFRATPKPAAKDQASNFEILVDEEILELDADDTIMEDDDS